MPGTWLKSGRPGPCWLDIPVDVQSAQVDKANLRAYDPAQDRPSLERDLKSGSNVREVLERIRAAKRPVILAGTGVRLANALDEFHQLVHKLQIPVTTAWTHDLIASDDTLFCGRPGTIGDRAGNFTVQNADLVLVLGSRLNVRQVSYNWQSFAPHAFKIQVDIDAAELNKPLVRPDLAIHSDLKFFLAELAAASDVTAPPIRPAIRQWLAVVPRARCPLSRHAGSPAQAGLSARIPTTSWSNSPPCWPMTTSSSAATQRPASSLSRSCKSAKASA